MSIDGPQLNRLIDAELAALADARVLAQIASLRCEPVAVMRRWDYGLVDQEYPCWTVLLHPASNTGIAYCEHGFGPSSPWGLVFLAGDKSQTSIGMDCSWYQTFLAAYFESQAATDLPIWRAIKVERATGTVQPISEEGPWDATWEIVTAYREADPTHAYECRTSIGPA